MVSPTFVGKLALLPWVVLKTTVQYYTVGTIYSNTNDEFKDSLKKNIIISVESYLASYMTKGDIKTFTYVDIKCLFSKLKTKDIVKNGNLNSFGKQLDDNSYWVVRNGQDDDAGNVLVYYHGGGYALGVMECQILGLIVMYHCLPPAVQKKLSILIVDYSLTIHGKVYPSQIHDAVCTYKNLVSEGYNKIYLMGDSAGANLALAVTRYVSYPDEALKEFSKYKSYSFPEIKGPQPQGLLLISPWVDPTINTSVNITSKTEWYGDLIGCETDMDKWYIEDVKKFIQGWITFNGTTYTDHWAEVECLKAKNKVLVIAGGRELLLQSIETWLDIVDKNRENVAYALEKGGIHDCIFNVEMIDYAGSTGAKHALDGNCHTKFCLSNVIGFLNSNMAD